jgi:hypothetical protein
LWIDYRLFRSTPYFFPRIISIEQQASKDQSRNILIPYFSKNDGGGGGITIPLGNPTAIVRFSRLKRLPPCHSISLSEIIFEEQFCAVLPSTPE